MKEGVLRVVAKFVGICLCRSLVPCRGATGLQERVC